MKNSELHHVLNTAAKRLRMRQVARSASHEEPQAVKFLSRNLIS